jgi:hypothetical protein
VCRDTTGTFAIAVALAAYKVITAVHKHYTIDEWIAFNKTAADDVMAHVSVARVVCLPSESVAFVARSVNGIIG